MSADCGVAPGATALLDIASTVNGAEVEAHPPLVPQGALLGHETSAASDPVTIYADPGSTVTVAALDSDTASTGGLIVGLYGDLVNTP
jgi:hypothetical protein